MHRILIVDDHPIFAEAFTIAASGARKDCMVDCATSLGEAEAKILATSRYHFVFLDLLLPDANGFSGLIYLKKLRPELPVAIISAREDSHTISMAHAFGAAAYLGKSLSLENMQSQLRRILSGEAVFPVGAKPVSLAEADIHKKIEHLSPAQFRVLRALCGGQLNKQIAEALGLAEATVKSHLAAVYRTLGVINRAQAIIAARPYLEALNAKQDTGADGGPAK